MGKIVRYEFVGDRIALSLQALGLAIVAIVLFTLLIAPVTIVVVYLLLTIVKIEEEIETPNEFIAGFKEGRFRK
jgi:hypothetical protein